jgi:hypothetical protein
VDVHPKLSFKNNRERREKRLAFVNGFAFPASAEAVLRRGRPDLDAAARRLAWAGLRHYLLLHADRPGRFLGMPSETVDAAWHAFMLCSAAYEAFCKEAFGRMLHHKPDPDASPVRMDGSTPFKPDVVATWKACEVLRSLFHDLPAIPIVFSLDAALGRGWIYTDGGIEALRRDAAEATGSGSSCGGSTCGGAAGGCGDGGGGGGCGSSCGGSCGGGGGGD